VAQNQCHYLSLESYHHSFLSLPCVVVSVGVSETPRELGCSLRVGLFFPAFPEPGWLEQCWHGWTCWQIVEILNNSCWYLLGIPSSWAHQWALLRSPTQPRIKAWLADVLRTQAQLLVSDLVSVPALLLLSISPHPCIVQCLIRNSFSMDGWNPDIALMTRPGFYAARRSTFCVTGQLCW
jgi:hypothetical protein